MKPLVIFAAALPLLSAACGDDKAVIANAASPSQPARRTTDVVVPIAHQKAAPLTGPRADLLSLANRAAQSVPAAPHHKTRNRLLETVAGACLELDAPDLARSTLESVDNWRRGTGFADLAWYHAKHGHAEAAAPWLEAALQVAEQVAADPTEQEWRADRVRARLARVHIALGETQRAAELTVGLSDSELVHVERARADVLAAGDLAAHLAQVDDVLSKGNYEHITAALETCTRLHARFYADAEARARLALRVAKASEKLPRQHAVQLHLQLAKAAIDHADHTRGQELLRDARSILDLGRWAPENKAVLAARIAELRARAGDRERARFEIDEALALVESERDKIIDIDRADALYPLAEAYAALDDGIASQQTYLQALDEALVNPNSVPRAEDLVAICLSLAKLGITPSAELDKRLREATGGLSHPW